MPMRTTTEHLLPNSSPGQRNNIFSDETVTPIQNPEKGSPLNRIKHRFSKKKEEEKKRVKNNANPLCPVKQLSPLASCHSCISAGRPAGVVPSPVKSLVRHALIGGHESVAPPRFSDHSSSDCQNTHTGICEVCSTHRVFL